MSSASEYEKIVTLKQSLPELVDLSPTVDNSSLLLTNIREDASKVGIWRLIAWVVANATTTLRNFFKQFIFDQEKLALRQKVHSIGWYQSQVLNFLDGKGLVWDAENTQFVYDISLTENPDDFKIISNCAVVEAPGALSIKVAKIVNNIREPLSTLELNRLSVYLQLIKDAGNTLVIVNQNPDLLNIEIDIFIDPLVLSTDGVLYSDITSNPVIQQISDYLGQLEFNGSFVISYFKDMIQKAEGVKFLGESSFQSKTAGFPYETFLDFKIPVSGYFKIDSLVINYKPYPNP